MKQVFLSHHAQEQMRERGASREEVLAAIARGQPEPARNNRVMYRLNIAYNARWGEKTYAVKQVAPVVAEEPDRLIVVTVYAFYF